MGFPDLLPGQKPVVNFGEVQRAQLAKSTLLTSTWCPWDHFSLTSIQILKREWGAESIGKLPHLFIPGKTAALVPEFAFSRTTALGSCACSEGPALGQNTYDD